MTIRKNALILGRAIPALLLLPVLILGGCGFYKNWQVGKKNQEVEALMDQARGQQADRYLPDLFTKATRALEDSRGAAEAGNYDEALASSDNARNLAEQMLSRVAGARAVIQEKQTALTEIQTKLTQTLSKVRTIAPEEAALIESASKAIANSQQILESPVQVSEGDQGYDAGLAAAKAALDEATTGLSRVEKDRAEKLVADLEDGWRRAQELEVPKYAPESARIPEAIQTAKSLIASASYAAVLELTTLQADLKRAIDRAREARAKARIEHAKRLIDLADAEPDADQDKINAAKTALDEAIAQSGEGKFDEAFASAESALSSARGEVKAVEDDLQQQIDDLTARIEEARKWETEKISADKFNQSVASVQKAKDLLREILFTDCQTAIDSGVEAIEEAIGEARTVKLAVRIREAETNLQATEDRGTYIYLKEDYQAIQGLIASATTQMDSASYDEAEATLAKAEELTLGLETGLRNLAQTRIAEVEAAYKEASEADANKNAPDMLQEASTALERARANAAKSEWREAIEASEGALTKAREAAQQTYKIRFDEMMPVAQKELDNAKSAGAAAYAAPVYSQALDAIDQSRVAYQVGDFKTALQKVEQARNDAVRARRLLVERAQEATNSAIEAKAQDYDPDTMAGALVDLADAKEKMEQGQFEPSRQSALSAEQKAVSAETKTWDLRGSQVITQLRENVERANAAQAPTYAAEEYRTLSKTLRDAEELYGAKNFEEAYRQADAGQAQADQLFAKIAQQADVVRREYDAAVNQLKTFTQDEFGIRLHSEATLRLGSLDEAIQRKDWGSVFTLYREGMITVEKAIIATKIHNINSQKDKLAQQIADAEQKGLFKLTKLSADQLRSEIAGLDYDPALDRHKPEVDYYREGIRALAKVESDLGRVRDMAISEADLRVQRIRTNIDNAREIGARDLTAAAFDSAVDSYERARDMVLMLRNPVEGAPPVDFNQLAQQIAEAESSATQLNESALTQRNAVNYIRDLIVWTYDMTRYLDQWYPVEELGRPMIEIADLTGQEHLWGIRVDITPRELLTQAESLYNRLKVVPPPAAVANLHQMALSSFGTFVESADSFYRFTLYTRYPKRMRTRYLAHAFSSLEQLHLLNETLITAILKQVKVFGLTEFERDLSNELSAFSTYLRRDKTAG